MQSAESHGQVRNSLDEARPFRTLQDSVSADFGQEHLTTADGQREIATPPLARMDSDCRQLLESELLE
jgi:hypothetical protein